MNKNATTQLHIYSAFFVLAGFVLNRGVFLLFLAEKGMSVTEIALYQALFNIATVVLELPTGLIGDFFGKKFSIGGAAAFLPYGWHAVALRPLSRRAFPC